MPETGEIGGSSAPVADPVQVTWLGGDGPDVDLAAALDRLPAAQRLAICLRYLDDCPVREVAIILDRSEGAVDIRS